MRDTPPSSSHHHTRSTCGKKTIIRPFLGKARLLFPSSSASKLDTALSFLTYASVPPPFPSCDGKKKCLFLKVLPLPFSVCPSQLPLKNSLRTIPLLLIVPKESFPCHEWICPRFFRSPPHFFLSKAGEYVKGGGGGFIKPITSPRHQTVSPQNPRILPPNYEWDPTLGSPVLPPPAPL